MRRDFWQTKTIFLELILSNSEKTSVSFKRESTFEHISILEVYEKAIEVFRDYYQYEVIQGADQKENGENTGSCFSEKQSPML